MNGIHETPQLNTVFPFFLYLIFCTSPLFAFTTEPKPVFIEGDTRERFIDGRHLLLFQDATFSMEIEAVHEKRRAGAFKQSLPGVPNLGVKGAQQWVYVTIENTSDKPWRGFIEIRYPSINYAACYEVKEEGYNKQVAGLSIPMGERTIPHRNHLFHLEIPANTQKDYYLTMFSGAPLQIPLYLMDQEAFSQKDRGEILGFGLFIGCGLIMICINGFLFALTGTRFYAYYCAYILVIQSFWLSFAGVFGTYLWPNYTAMHQRELGFLLPLTIITEAAFCANFLRTRYHHKTIHRLIWALVGLGFCQILMTCATFYAQSSALIVTLAILVLVSLGLAYPLFLWAGISIYRAGFQPARFYILSRLPLVIFFVYAALEKLGVLDRLFSIYQTGMVLTVFEMILLAFAMGDRFQALRRERNLANYKAMEAQQILAKELEQKVVERTHQLNEALAVQKEQHQELLESHRQVARTQEQLLIQARMAATSRLASGLAHELRNPLNFINNFSQLSEELVGELKSAQSNPESSAEWEETIADLVLNLQNISKYGARAESIVSSMVNYVQDVPEHWQHCDFNNLVETSLNTGQHILAGEGLGLEAISETIEIHRDYDEECGEVALLPKQIVKALSQVFINSFEAIALRESQSGVVRITTRRLDDEVELICWDNGIGMNAESLSQALVPFFTEKEDNRHTGLGLAITYEVIVTHHKGSMRLQSEYMQFTEVVIRIPVRH